ncbi:30S ribosomal protein S6 [Candidatus Nesciobacter abundans]|uniref:Small ribosomal subunit protein bS6 n=1 Tax=Candidatus Nesciobacter abundans TaxID=2601668 RepID=A0A5C0UHU0_9PROT|nr:30S ribosomal protein S6 [Candidatus Nesciobacter abundans]QEK39143.1 30S ribosomal protein S6 [Candidatus Nesciobacter abundans]
MRNYRLNCVLKQNISEEEAEKVVDQISKEIDSLGGKEVSRKNFGLNKLKYEIQRNIRGHYILMDFNLPSEQSKKLVNTLKLNKDLIRYMIRLLDKKERPLTEVQSLFDPIRDPRNRFAENKIDYLRDTSRMTTPHGRILAPKILGFSAKEMRRLSKAIKERRFLALMPYKA